MDRRSLLGVGAPDFDVEHVDVGEALEEDGLALHDGLAGERSDVTETEHRRPVADHRYEIPLVGVAEDVFGPILDLEARLGHTGGVGEAEIVLGGGGLGGTHFQLPGTTPGVIVERFTHRDLHWRPRPR
jgi:hypothetical protein